MKLNFGVVPFSYAGSYLALSYPQDEAVGYENDLTIRILYGLFTDQANFPIYLLDGQERRTEGEIIATETELTLKNGERRLQVCFQNAKTLIIRSNTRAVITKRRLSTGERIMVHDHGHLEIASFEESLIFETTRGMIKNDADWNAEGVSCTNLKAVFIPDEDGVFECQMTLCGLSYIKPEPCEYGQALERVQKEYDDFRALFKTKRSDYQASMEEAAYISWHSIINPEGYVKYPVMLMTKNKMNQVWTWDYAINALAMVDKDPQLAYEQFLAVAACQDETGVYADCFQAKTMIKGFVKPPIQGFVLKRMFEIHKPSKTVMEQLYQTTVSFTNWWFQYRGRHDGIPEYHHGNDSGWDNSTVFGEGLPVKAPDLCAWLVEQMDFLANTAEELGKAQESKKWREQSDALLSKMIDYFVRDDQFVAYKEPEHRVVKCDSLLLYIPLILGKKLPSKVRGKMLEKLLEPGRFLTEYGIASEPLDSERFVEDGYWRGAVWPPTAYIMTELLMRNGKTDEAIRNAEGFCKMCAKSGFYENYSAIDGHGLRDSGFTWTASAFMILLRDYIEKCSI